MISPTGGSSKLIRIAFERALQLLDNAVSGEAPSTCADGSRPFEIFK